MPGQKTGIRRFDDLKKRTRFNMGAAAQGTASFMNAAVLKNLLGVAVHLVTGYQGSGEVRIAIERGELDGDCGTWSSVPAHWIANGMVNPVVRFSSMPVPGVPADVPFVGDLAGNEADKALLDMLLAPDALGRPYVVSRKVPADRLLGGSARRLRRHHAGPEVSRRSAEARTSRRGTDRGAGCAGDRRVELPHLARAGGARPRDHREMRRTI